MGRPLHERQRSVAQLQDGRARLLDGKTTSGVPTLMIMSTNTVVNGRTSRTSHRPRATVRPRHAGSERYPDPGDCQKYFTCQRGQLQLQACAGGLYWNKEEDRCDWADGTQCQLRGVQIEEEK